MQRVWLVLMMMSLGFAGLASTIHAESIPRPAAPTAVGQLPAEASGLALTAALMGVGYRDDGALDSQGRYTTFEEPRKIHTEPGFNCSGFTLAAWRFLTGQNIALDAARADNNGNSGPSSPLGEDWDFGFDLITNLATGYQLAILAPDGETATSHAALLAADPMDWRGFPMADAEAWRKVASRMAPGDLALATVSKRVKRAPYQLLHYHVGVLAAEGGRVWFMHATPKSGVHRFDIATAKGAASLAGEFKGNAGDKRVLVLRTRQGG